MKLHILILAAFLFLSCAAEPPTNNVVVNEQTRAKNKLTAVKNEVTEITRVAQKIEQYGRDLEPYRETSDAESARQCNLIVEDRRKQIVDLETRVNNLPDDYKARLMPIVSDLNECVTCQRKALNGCKKARASINQLIKEIYP